MQEEPILAGRGNTEDILESLSFPLPRGQGVNLPHCSVNEKQAKKSPPAVTYHPY